ncbi:MAG TPA: VWA domain-containing protein [Reyranella sp.]|nr:VWA domain-containing protein [Reyranella sp.]
MSDLDQVPFGASEFADNPEPRCPCLLLLDTSASMKGAPIDELNRGLAAFKEELASDALAMKRVELGIVTFGGSVRMLSDFQTPDQFHPPTLGYEGDTPMGAAISGGLEMIRQRKDAYKANGIPYYRPWVFLITDGVPTDAWNDAASKIKTGEAAKSFSFFAVGVENADMDVLAQISVRAPLKLSGLRFRDLFAWLSSSLSSISRSRMDQTVQLQPPGWAEI